MNKLIVVLVAILGTLTIHSESPGRVPGRLPGKVLPPAKPVITAPAPVRTNAPAIAVRTNAPSQLGPIYTINLHDPGVSITIKASRRFTVNELRQWLREAMLRR